MAPTLRKRKAPEPATAPAPKKVAKATPKKLAAPKKPTAAVPATTSASGKKITVGDIIDIDTFGGEVEANDGEKTSLKKLLEASGSGVVLFTYPKASTPGCKLCALTNYTNAKLT